MLCIKNDISYWVLVADLHVITFTYAHINNVHTCTRIYVEVLFCVIVYIVDLTTIYTYKHGLF